MLDWAAARGLPRALATSSSRRDAEISLAEAGLAGRFDAEVTGDQILHGKPAPDLFLLAAHRLGVAPASCLVFEDAPAGLGGRGSGWDAPHLGAERAFAALVAGRLR